MSITVRDGSTVDAPVIARLVQELAIAIGETMPVDENYACEYLAYPGNHVLLAELDGRVVGMLSYNLHPNLYHAAQTCMIEELVVKSGARDQGVGSALVKALLQRAAALGCAEVSVSTMLDNHGAIRFYRRHGLVDEALLLERHL